MKSQRLKSMALAAAATLSFAAPLAFSTQASAEPNWNRHGYNERYDRSEREAYRDGYRDSRYRDRHDWRRGDRPSYRERQYWREVNYRDHRFRAPPRGYHYVRDNRTGDYLLVGIATGVVLGIIASH
jgi:Ni/Co efflux regulator RcnB